MENDVKGLSFANKVYCPCCGKAVINNLYGVLENPCPRCHTNLKVIVKGTDYTVFGIQNVPGTVLHK